MNATRVTQTRADAGTDAGLDVRTDQGLAAIARSLVDEIAPLLGLRAADIHIQLGNDALVARSIGAHGMAHGHTIELAVGGPTLATNAGRGLVAHELTHLAQGRGELARHGNVRPGGFSAEIDRELASLVAAAESEARAVGAAAATGASLWRPKAHVPREVAIANTGTALAPKPAAAPAGGKASKASPDEIRRDAAGMELSMRVAERYKHLADRLKRIADCFIVDGDSVSEALNVVSTLPFLEARSLFRMLNGVQRLDLAEELTDDHHREFPEHAVALLAACPPIIANRLSPSNVSGMNPEALTPLAKSAGREVLRGLNHDVLVELMTGPSKARFTSWAAEYPAAVDELAAILAATNELKTATVKEQNALVDDQGAVKAIDKVVADVRKLLATPTCESALEAVRVINTLQPAPEPAKADPAAKEGARPTTSTQTTPAGPPLPHAKVRIAVRSLEQDQAIERLLDHLAPEDRTAGSAHAGELQVVLAAREPGLNLAKAESLLSYGLFDWAITDAEARYAYVLLRSVPTGQQDRFLNRDNGKWFQRLEENLPPEDILTGRYRGLGSAADPFDYATSNQVVTDAMTVVRDVHVALEKEDMNAQRAEALLRKLINLGRHTGMTSPSLPGSGVRGPLQVACSRLDALGDIDRLFDYLSNAFLYQEQPRQMLLELMAARQPQHLQRSARRLLSLGFTDWAVTAREAWVAFYVIRSLSPSDQAAFAAANPDLWSRLQGEMTADMRASTAVTNLGGAMAFSTRDRVRDRVRDPALWVPARVVELRSLIIQLQALDDGAWVFRTSRQMLASKPDSDLKQMSALITQRKLWEKGTRENYQAEQLKSAELEGPLQLLAEAFGYLRLLPAVLQIARTMFTDTIRVTDLDLKDVSGALGGDIFGARVATDEQVADLDKKEKSEEVKKQANRLNISINTGDGIIEVTLPRLEISQMNRAFPGMSIRTGRINLTGLKIVASFSDRGYNRPVGAVADVEKANVDDAVVSTESVPGGVLSAANVGLTTLHLRSGATGTEDLQGERSDEWVSIPILTPILHALSHIVAFNGSVPGLSGLVTSAITAPAAGSGIVAEQFTKYTTGAVVEPIVDGMVGLVTDGVFRKPRTVAERGADAMAMMRSLEISFATLDIAGVSLGGVQQIENVKIRDFALGAGTTKPTMLRHQKTTLQTRLKDSRVPADEKPKIAAEIKTIDDQLKKLEPLEKILQRLEARHRWNDKDLNEDERKQLRTLSAQLRTNAGGGISVGSIELGKLSGKIEAAGVDIAGISGTGSMQSRAGEYLPADDLIERLRGERTAPAQSDKDLIAKSALSVHTGAITLKTSADGSPALVVRAGVLPTADAVDRQIARLEKLPAYRESPFLAELQAWPELLRQLAVLEAVSPEPVDLGGRLIVPRDRDGKEHPEFGPVIESGPDVTKRRLLRDRAERFFGLSVQSLELGPAFAVLEQADEKEKTKPTVRVGVSTLEAKGIKSGATTVGSISGTNVSLGLAIDPSVATRSQPEGAGTVASEGFKRNGVDIGADGLTVRDVKQPGLDLKRMTVNGVRGNVVPEGDNWSIPSLVIASAELEGLTYSDGTTTIFANGTTTTGVIDASIRVLTRKGPEPGTREMSELLIDSLHFEKINAAQVGMDVGATRKTVRTKPDGSKVEEVSAGYRVEAEDGGLVGVQITGMRIPMADPSSEAPPAPTTGTIGIGSFDNLRFAVLSKVFQGKATTIKGALDGGAPPQADGTSVNAITVHMLASGAKKIDLAGGALVDTAVETADGKIRIRRMGLSGTIGVSGNRTSFERMGPFDLDVASIDWSAGSAKILAKGSTMLQGVSLDGYFESTPDTETTPAGGGTAKRTPGTKALHLNRLHVDRVRSDDLRYVDGALDVHLGRTGAAGPLDPAERRNDLLEIGNINVVGLHWDSLAGVSSGAIQTGAVKAAFGGRLSQDIDAATKKVVGALHMKGSLAATGIRVDFLKGGRVMARATGITGELGLGGTGDADDHHLTWGDPATGKGLDTGLIDINGDVIDFGPDGSDGISLNTVSLDKLSWNWAGPGFGLQVPSGHGYVTMNGIRARVRVLLHPKGSAAAKNGRLKEIHLRELIVGETKATGLGVRFDDAVLRLSETQIATLGEIKLRPATDGIKITPSATKGGKTEISGGLDIAKMLDGSDGISLPNVTADVSASLHGTGNVAAQSLALDFFGAEGLSVTVTKPSIKAIELAFKGDSTLPGGGGIHTAHLIRGKTEQGLPQFGLSADTVEYTDTNKKGEGPKKGVTATGIGITGLEYRNSELGISLFVPDAKIPNLSHDLLADKGKFDNIDITNAWLSLDLISLLGAPTPAGASEERTLTKKMGGIASKLLPYADVVDSLNGSMSMSLLYDDMNIPIKTTFVDGAFDYEALLANAQPGLPWYTRSLQFGIRGNSLFLDLPTGVDDNGEPTQIPLMAWDLGADQAMAEKSHRIKILRSLKGQPIYNAKVGGPGPTKKLEVRNVEADLSTKNPNPIVLPLKTLGSITLARNAIAHLKASGDVGGNDASGNPTLGVLQPISLDRATFDALNLTLDAATIGTGTIEITDVKDGRMTFVDMNPTTFSATIGKATAKGVNWTIIKSKGTP